ncbi:MAG: Gfo/Idh/MocA family oxidoreductase [Salinibacterium sp.]|nr:Gfo/Idh/MocA family oxidoreductase [Salinibacterium sp.]
MTRVAVVGVGSYGLEHLAIYSTMRDVELVGVCDADSTRAESAAHRFGTVRVSAAALVADAVSIAVPVQARGTLVTDLLSAGTAVLIEKPLAATGPEADELVRAAAGRVAMVGHVLRFAEPYRRLARSVVHLGELRKGVLTRRRSASHFDRYPHDDVIGLTLIHDLDAVHWLSGSTSASVSATGRRGQDGRWVYCRAQITMSTGAVFTVEAEWVGSDSEQSDTAYLEGSVDAASLTVSSADAGIVYGDALAAELRHFVSHAVTGTPSTELSMTDAARAVHLADAVRASLDHEGKRYDLAS